MSRVSPQAEAAAKPKSRRIEVLPTLVASLFLLGSAWFARRGNGFGWWAAAFWGVMLLGLILSPKLRSLAERNLVNELEASPLGLTRRFGDKRRSVKTESISWDQVVKIEIVTTDEGPSSEDFFFVLHGADGGGVVVPQDLAVKHGLLSELQQRFAGLDNQAVIEASLCVDNRRFLVWKK
jgi:hypothetical protein